MDGTGPDKVTTSQKRLICSLLQDDTYEDHQFRTYDHLWA